MKTEQEQRRGIRQILFGANDICQATPCENEYCIYHGNYRCYDNVIVDKLIKAGYGDVTEYKAEIERLKAEVKQAQIDVLNKTKKFARRSLDCQSEYAVDVDYIDELIKEVNENDADRKTHLLQ